MAKQNVAQLSFTAGEISKRALARVDVAKLRLAAEIQENWLPQAVGPMSLRPGLGYVGGVKDDAATKMVPFIFGFDDTAGFEFTTGALRVWVDDVLVPRQSVTTAITSSDFSATTGWTFSRAGIAAGTMGYAQSGTRAINNGNGLFFGMYFFGWDNDQVATVAIQVNSVTTPGNWQAAIYRGTFGAGNHNSGNPEVLLASSDVVGITTTGQVVFTFATPVTIQPGIWFWAVVGPTGGTPEMGVSITTSSQFQGGGQNAVPTSIDGTGSGFRMALGGLTKNSLILANAGLGAQSTASQAVTAIEIGIEHAVRFTVTNGPVTVAVGLTSGGQDYIARTVLGTGTHSLVFTPTVATFYVYIESVGDALRTVTAASIEQASPMVLPTPWLAADLPFLRWTQSGDVVFVACNGARQRKIIRRAVGSWSIEEYLALDGPFQSLPSVKDVSIRVPNSTANGFAVTNRPFFKPAHVGCMFKLNAGGQSRYNYLAAENQFTRAIKVIGTGTDRNFDWAANFGSIGSFVGTLTLQRSFEGPDGGWIDIATKTSGGSTTVTDALDNLIVWYRVGFKQGEYTSGASLVGVTYNGGADYFIIKVLSYINPTSVTIENLRDPNVGSPVFDWQQGDWSDADGWPDSVDFHDGRLMWAGRDKVWGSVSDIFDSFDEATLGDSGPLNRSFGYGPFDRVNWLMSLLYLVAGREMSEVSIKSSALNAPLTPTDFSMKNCSSQGAARTGPVKVDTRGIFVQQSTRRLYELQFDFNAGDYKAHDLNTLNVDIGLTGFVSIAVQRQPDTRIHCVRGDGQVAVLTYDKETGIEAWWRVVTDGLVEDVMVLPGTLEDQVYYVVNRTINGAPKRFLEKFARLDECTGAALNKQADAFVVYSGASSTIVPVPHLEGEDVVVWANGKDLGTYTVASGQITVSEAVTTAVVGLSYAARFKSAKLAYGALQGTALNQKKQVDQIGLILVDTHYQGVEYGQDFDTMDNLPLVEDGVTTPADTIWSQYDAPMTKLPGEWHTDSRLCLRATAPRPATVCAAIIQVDTNEKT